MSWNYRVLKSEGPPGEVVFEIVEMHYDDAGRPNGYARASVLAEDVNGLSDVLAMQAKALSLPVLQDGERGIEEVTDG